MPFAITPHMRIGVLPIGYSDGMHRLNCGEVLVRGERVPLLGAPALEYTRIDLTRVPAARVGDEVVIIGRQGANRVAPEEVAKKQAAARVSDLALEVRSSVARRHIDGTEPRPPAAQAPDAWFILASTPRAIWMGLPLPVLPATVLGMWNFSTNPLYLASMSVSVNLGRLRGSAAKRVTASAETAQRACGSGRARSPFPL